ncbi:MAG: hypothetical protein IPO98_19515 [Saprospiraceae bacterium]|nr:hypothetical protein [Saprospiraceae bacterium]
MKLYRSILIFLYFYHISAQSLKLEDIMKGDGSSAGNRQAINGLQMERPSILTGILRMPWDPVPFSGRKVAEKPALLKDDQSFNGHTILTTKDQETVYYIKSGSIYSFDKENRTSKRYFIASERLSIS